MLTTLGGYGLLAITCLGSLLYLLQDNLIRAKRLGATFKRLPSLDRLDQLCHTTLVTGFTLMTLGLLTGAAYAQIILGSYWRWDPKEVWSLITWLLYAALLHTRLVAGWRGPARCLAEPGGLLRPAVHLPGRHHQLMPRVPPLRIFPHPGRTPAVNLVLVGLNHRTSPVEVRECLAPAARGPAGQAARNARPGRPCAKASCSPPATRVEALAAVDDSVQAGPELVAWFTRGAPLNPGDLQSAVYLHQGPDAVRQPVPGGLQPGFPGAGRAPDPGTAQGRLPPGGPDLHLAAPCSTACCIRPSRWPKRVRTETRIGSEAISISSAAVDLACKIFDTLAGRAALLVGAGEMAELAAEHLLGHGISRMLVANRTLARAQELAQRFHGQALSLDEVPQTLSEVDIVITSTGADKPLITADLARRSVKRRRGRPLFFIDIAVPRDVAPGSGRYRRLLPLRYRRPDPGGRGRPRQPRNRGPGRRNHCRPGSGQVHDLAEKPGSGAYHQRAHRQGRRTAPGRDRTHPKGPGGAHPPSKARP